MSMLVKPNGIKLHMLRISKEMTIKDLAQRSNISCISVKKIESGKEVSTLTAGKISNALQINIFDYFDLI